MPENTSDFSFRKLFIPFTTGKAISIIIIVGFLVFFNTLFNGFVWDDLGQIVNNDNIHSLSNVGVYFFGNQDEHGNLVKIPAVYYRPLMATSFAVVYSFFGPNPFFFHLISLIFQIIITILVFFFFRRFFKLFLSFILAIIFLIHPLNSEVVNYISSYNDLMYLFFGMLALFLLQKETISTKRLIVVSSCIFLSLLSKEQGILFVPILFIYIYYFHRKFLLRAFAMFIGAISLYLILRNTFYVGIPADKVLGFSSYLHMSFLQHLVNIPKLFFYYMSNFFFPDNLAIAQQWSVQDVTFADFYFPLVILLVFIAFNVFLITRSFTEINKKNVFPVFFFSIWFWIGIGLYMQFIPLDMTVADRWFYFPIVGLLALLSIFFESLSWKYKTLKKMAVVLLVVWMIFLGIRTILRNQNWYDEYTLYTHDLKISPESFDLENQLGIVYFNAGKFDDAKIHFENSISLWGCSQSLGNLGYLYKKQDDFINAKTHFIRSIECNDLYKSYGNLIILLYNKNELQEAEYYSNKGLNTYPNSPAFYYFLGLIKYKQGDKESAIKNLLIFKKFTNDSSIDVMVKKIQAGQPINGTLDF